MLQTASKTAYIAQTRQLFHCHCKIKVPLHYGEALLDTCFAIMDAVDRRYNSYQTGSYFDQINRHAGQWVLVDKTTVDILNILKKISAITQGAYAVSSMPLLQLWGFYKQEVPAIPSARAIAETLRQVNDDAIEIDGCHVRIQKGQALITGSFVKAVAVDQVTAYLRSFGVTDAIINAGGSTILALNDASHPQWMIRVPDATATGQDYTRMPLSNACFSFSGKKNNNLLIDNVVYSHILHGKSGWPAATSQVTVRSETAFLGDVLSTAIFVVAPQDRDRVLHELAQHFSFHYCRVEENGEQIQSTCYGYHH